MVKRLNYKFRNAAGMEFEFDFEGPEETILETAENFRATRHPGSFLISYSWGPAIGENVKEN